MIWEIKNHKQLAEFAYRTTETQTIIMWDERDRFAFSQGNSIPFGQNLGFYRGVPHDIVFTVKPQMISDSDIILVLKAPGFGGDPYGNGAIYISIPNNRNADHFGFERLS